MPWLALRMPNPDLSLALLGSITAPAGCGKTQLIADSLRSPNEAKPALILTHTNSGKAVLEQRLGRAGVASKSYRVSTIESWAIKLVRRFPITCGLAPKISDLENPKSDYPAIRVAAAALLESGHIEDPLQATYSRVLVDEYQDCGLDQHRMIVAASKVLPTVVLGDPLQAIFSFSGPTVDWHGHVRKEFPHLRDLDIPWRWRNAGAESLGAWLLSIRPALLAGSSIDLSQAPTEVSWVRLSGDLGSQHMQRMEAARTKAADKEGTVLVIADSTSPTGQRSIANCTPGAISVEAVDLRDFTAFGRSFNPTNPAATAELIKFAGEMMTHLSPGALINRVEILMRGKSRTPPTPVEHAALMFRKDPSHAAAAKALRAFSDGQNVRLYRPDVFRMCVSALSSAGSDTNSLYEAVIRERERHRHLSRRVPRRAVGSTLLLKGLEADVAVVLYPEKMNGSNLYVAMTRGAKRLVICSPTPVLTPVK